jgi:hypothetical protein
MQRFERRNGQHRRKRGVSRRGESCLANTETLKLHPAWFRFDVNGMPKGFIPDDTPEFNLNTSEHNTNSHTLKPDPTH